MPAALGIVLGRSCGAVEACRTLNCAQAGIGPVHVAHDDGDVLEPAVVAPGVGRSGPTRRREILSELEQLVTQAGAAPPGAGLRARPRELSYSGPDDLGVRRLGEVEHLGVEVHRAINI